MIFIEPTKERNGVLYVPIPKIACTTLKSHMYFLINNKPFEPYIVGNKTKWIHDWSQTLFYDDWSTSELLHDADRNLELFRFCIVRDPIQRVLSCYKNRIIHHKDLSKPYDLKHIVAHNLLESPSLEYFVDHIESYVRNIPAIHHHISPMERYLGNDLSFYSNIYDISEIDSELIPKLESIFCQTIPLKKEQKSNSAMYLEDLKEDIKNKIKLFYETDYKLFGNYFKT